MRRKTFGIVREAFSFVTGWRVMVLEAVMMTFEGLEKAL
jgi:hypothetical protein